jgi:hypothetical protein
MNVLPAARWPYVPLAELEQREPFPPEIREFGDIRMTVFKSKSCPNGEIDNGRFRPRRLNDEGRGVVIREPVQPKIFFFLHHINAWHTIRLFFQLKLNQIDL